MNRPALASLSLRAAPRTGPFRQIVAGRFACGLSMDLPGTHGLPAVATAAGRPARPRSVSDRRSGPPRVSPLID